MPLWPSFRRYFKHPLGWFFYFYYIAKINIKQRLNLFLEKPNDSFYADVVFSLTITTLEKIEVTNIVFHFLTIKSIPPQSIYIYFSLLIPITDFTCFTYSPLFHKGKVPTEPRVFHVFPRVFCGNQRIQRHSPLQQNKAFLPHSRPLLFYRS